MTGLEARTPGHMRDSVGPFLKYATQGNAVYVAEAIAENHEDAIANAPNAMAAVPMSTTAILSPARIGRLPLSTSAGP